MTYSHKRIDDLIYPERDGEELMQEMAGEIERLEKKLETMKSDRDGYILIANRSDKYERRR